MKVNVEKEQNNIAKMEIEVPAKDAVAEYNKAVKSISEYVNIPGFRKGKAPRAIVEKHVGVESIKHEALEHLLPKIFRDAIMENKLDVISQPTVESYDFEVGKDLKISAKVELRPEVELGNYKDLTVEAEEYETPADALDKSIESLLQRHATSEVVVDRPTNATDTVLIDFDGSVNGEKIQGGAAKNYSLDLGHSNFIPGFAEQLVGKNLNDEFDINVDFPKEYHDEKLAGQPAVFKIKINEIKEKVLPELNDELAQKAGPFKTVDDLKADIQSYLDTTKKNEDKKKAENAIFEKVLADVKVEIQDSMIERESKSLLEEYKQRLSMQGFNWEEAMKSQDQDELTKSLKDEAVARIKNSLVIDKIAQVENLKIESSDIEKKLAELSTGYGLSREQILKQFQTNPALFNSLSQQAMNEKVVEFLLANNKVEYKKSKKSSK